MQLWKTYSLVWILAKLFPNRHLTPVAARAYNSEHQMQLIDELMIRMAQPEECFRLLIIDSIMALFRVDYSGRGELADRQQKLNQMLSKLIKAAEVSPLTFP